MVDADDLTMDPAVLDRIALIMSQVGSDDVERVDPPAALWGRIAASIAVATPVGGPSTSSTVVEYSINADDVVFAVSEDWAAVAREGGAPELVELGPARTLWSYFDNDEVRDLWRLLIGRVRAEQAEAHIPLRCDAPELRRWFDITVTPEPDNVVRFTSVLVFEQPRDSVTFPVTLSTQPNEVPAVPVCAWCGRGHDGSEWLEIEELLGSLRLLENPTPSITSGICPTCRALMSADLRASSVPA